MLKKVLVLILSLALVSGLLIGCGNQGGSQNGQQDQEANNESATTSNEDQKKILIGYASLDETIDMVRDVKSSIIANAEKEGIEVICVDNKSDGATAVKNTDDLILQGVDVIVMFNTDAATNEVIKEKCDAAGIPVMGVDIPVPNSPTMGADNVESGKLVGRTLGELAQEHWDGQVDKLLLVDLPRSGEIVKLRMDNIIYGVQEILKDFPEDKVVRVDGKNDVLPAQQVTADFLTANPDARHILIGTLNDLNAQGALAAVQSAGRDEHCLMVSHGISTPALANLKSGEDNCWKAGVAYFPEKYGAYIVPAAIKLAKGESVPDYIPMDHIVMTRENINDYYPDK